MALAQDLSYGHDGTGTGLIDWHDGTGTVAQSQARERFPGHDDACTIQQAQWHRNDGVGLMHGKCRDAYSRQIHALSSASPMNRFFLASRLRQRLRTLPHKCAVAHTQLFGPEWGVVVITH